MFAQIVAYSQEINTLFKQLAQYGKTMFKEEKRKEVLRLRRNTDELQKMQNYLISELYEWKQLIAYLRKEYYFLTYVPNAMISDLIESFDNPSDTPRLKELVS